MGIYMSASDNHLYFSQILLFSGLRSSTLRYINIKHYGENNYRQKFEGRTCISHPLAVLKY